MLIIVWPQLPLTHTTVWPYFNKGSDWANLLNKNSGIINQATDDVHLQPNK